MTQNMHTDMVVPQERDRDLVRLLAESFLILTRDQIRELWRLGNVRRANFRLKQLCDAGLLSARPVVEADLTVAHGYFLGPRAYELFPDTSERAEIERLRKQAVELSPRAFPHRHFVDSVHIRFLTAGRQYPDYRLLTWVDQYSPWWQGMRDYGLAAQADAYVEYLMLLDADSLHTLFLEVDTGTEKSAVVRKKIDAYSAYARFFVRSAEINDYTLRLSEAIRVTLPRKIEGKRSLIARGDLLITITGANVGKCAKVDTDIPEAYVSQSVALIKLAEQPLAPIVYYALRAPNAGESQLLEMAYGVGRPVLSLPQIKSINIPLPPYAEQERIIAKIQELDEDVRSTRDHLAKVPKILKAFRQSVLAAACSGRLTEDWRASARYFSKNQPPNSPDDIPFEVPQGWAWMRNKDIASTKNGAICAGPFGTIFKAKDFRDAGIPIIFLRHVGEGKYSTQKPGFMDKQKWEELFKPYSVYGGELLVTKLGDPPGTAAIYPRGIGPAMVTPDVIKMEVDERQAEPAYLMFFFNSQVAKRILFGLAFGATRLRIDLPMFKNLWVPLPPLDEQQEIVRRVEVLFKLADKIEKRVEAATKRADKLTQAILAKAFRGDLVPTEAELARKEGREYEPASALLERIKAERDKATTTNGTNRRAVGRKK